MKPETIINTHRRFAGKIMNVDQHEVRLRDGQTANREVIVKNNAVVIVPVTPQREIRLVRQYRVAVDRWLLELPAGGLEPGEDPDDAAPRELLEETGDRAATWVKLNSFYPTPGICTEFMHLYLATELTPGPSQPEFDEYLEIVTIPWREMLDMIRRREIDDGKTVAGVLTAGLYLGWIGETP